MPFHISKLLPKKSVSNSPHTAQFPTIPIISYLFFFSEIPISSSISEPAMIADDFSFPVVQTPLSHHFAVDPTSFWCVSPQSFSGHSHAGADDDDDRGRRSGGWCSPREGEEEKVKGEEKMDMLWEAFNEELKRVCSKKEAPPPGVVEVCCVQALEMSPRRTNGGGVVSHRRQSVVVVGLKVLKKMFLLHNSARFIMRRKPDRCYLNR